MTHLNERDLFLRLIESLLNTYRPEGVVIWLTGGNRALDGFSLDGGPGGMKGARIG